MKFDGIDIKFKAADRSWNNESEAKDMSGCLCIGDLILAYIPTGKTAARFAKSMEQQEGHIDEY